MGYTRNELNLIAGQIRRYANKKVKHQYLEGVNGRKIGFVATELTELEAHKLRMMASQIEALIADDYQEDSTYYPPSVLPNRGVP